MEEKKIRELTEQELLNEAKKMKSFSIINALFIGFLLGIIFVSIYYNAYGVGFLIPLFLIYKIVKDPKNKRSKELNELLKERNLK